MLSSLLSKNLSQKSQEHKEDPINLLDQVNLPSNNIDNIEKSSTENNSKIAINKSNQTNVKKSDNSNLTNNKIENKENNDDISPKKIKINDLSEKNIKQIIPISEK